MFKRLESLIKDVNINIILLIVLILILFSVLVYFRRGVEGFQITEEDLKPSTTGPCACSTQFMGECYDYSGIPSNQAAVDNWNTAYIEYNDKNPDGSQTIAWVGNTPADCNQIPPSVKQTAEAALSAAIAANPILYSSCICDSSNIGKCTNRGSHTNQSLVDAENASAIYYNLKSSDGSQVVYWLGRTQSDCNQMPPNALADAQSAYTNLGGAARFTQGTTSGTTGGTTGESSAGTTGGTAAETTTPPPDASWMNASNTTPPADTTTPPADTTMPGAQGPCVCDSTWMGNCNSYGAQTQEAVNQRNKIMIEKKEKNSDGSQAVAWYGSTPAECNQIPANAREDAARAYTNSAGTSADTTPPLPDTPSPPVSLEAFINFIGPVLSTKQPSWVTSYQREQINSFIVNHVCLFLSTYGFTRNNTETKQLNEKYAEYKQGGDNDSVILDKIIRLYDSLSQEVINSNIRESDEFYLLFISAALPGILTGGTRVAADAWITPDITKKARSTLRRLAHYLIVKTPNLDFSNLPKFSLLDNLRVPLKAEYDKSSNAGDSSLIVTSKCNAIINTYITDNIGKPPQPIPKENESVNITCKLTDLFMRVPGVSIFSLLKIPETVDISITDTTSGVKVWDPIKKFIDEGIIEQFPSSTEMKTYTFKTGPLNMELTI
jgi:hypothetical protein